ncbi:YceI family protein [Aquimarina mytili]|uniref:YceI family protein n=1 Tax=Aquimarina mytili TaxID=874423 RepID=A0A937D563_9FLAO|nr:YceI family protein [Aquimarina mytili]MBL0682959.1 YceI family protein [Aquimarina mytili]
MKVFLNILLTVIITQGFCQDLTPNTTGLNTNPNSELSLINDFKGLDIDIENSKVTFDFIHENTSGTISGLDFRIDFNPSDPENAVFKGSALVKTIDTDNFLRDGHLMWEKFFYKKKYPKITFTSTQVVEFENNTFKVIGNLTIKGIQKEVIITFNLNDKLLLGKTTIHTSDYGVNIFDERQKNELDIQFHFPILK